jgi:hypothetical protein
VHEEEGIGSDDGSDLGLGLSPYLQAATDGTQMVYNGLRRFLRENNFPTVKN